MELTVVPSPALKRRLIEWKADEPCICKMAFAVRNISASLHLSLRLCAEPRNSALSLHCAETATAEGSLPNVGRAPATEFAEKVGMKAEAPGGQGDDPDALDSSLLAPLCTPVWASREEENLLNRQKVILPDYCYNDGLTKRLASRIVTYSEFPSQASARPPSVVTEDHTNQGYSVCGGINGYEGPWVQGEVAQPRMASAANQHFQESRGQTQFVAPKEPPQPNVATSHAALALEMQQQLSRDQWVPPTDLEPQGEVPVALSEGCCIWLGKVSHDVGVLGPGGCAYAEFTALFPCPGVYNLNALKAQVTLVADDTSVQGTKRRYVGEYSSRSNAQESCTRTAGSAAAQLARSGWPAGEAAAVITFPFDFLVHVVCSESA